MDEDGLTATRKDWEKVLLRRVYRREMQGTATAVDEGDAGIALKRNYAHCLGDIEPRWTAASYWMSQLDLSAIS